MISDKATAVCLVAFSLLISGCSSSGNENGVELQNDDVVVAQVDLEGTDEVLDEEVVAELPLNTDAAFSIATPVTPISSFEMDEFIVNPLLTAIPSEMSRNSSNVTTKGFTVNPLLD